MNSKRMFGILTVMLLLGMSVLVFAPGASAQSTLTPACQNAAQPAITIKPGTQAGGPTPIKPITGQGQVSFDVEWKAAAGYSLTPVIVNVKITPKNPEYTTLSYSPQSFTVGVPAQPSGQEITDDETIQVDVSFSQNAPAFDRTGFTIEVTGTDGTCVAAPAPKDGESPTLTVGFYERYQVRFEKAVHKTGQNAQIAIPMVAQNFGNGDIQLRFALAEQSAGALSTALPPPVIVRSLVSGGETDLQNVNIDVQTPFKNGYENRRDSFILNVDGNAADDIDMKLTQVQLSAVIQTQGVYVPGFEAVTMISALLGALFVARRRL